jgi:stage II sporulation protein D
MFFHHSDFVTNFRRLLPAAFIILLALIFLWYNLIKRRTAVPEDAGVAGQPQVRVLIMNSLAVADFECKTGFRVISISHPTLAVSYPDEHFAAITLRDSEIIVAKDNFGTDIEIHPICGEGQFPVFTIAGRQYRGSLRLISENGGFSVINTLQVESYLAGVISAEMPANWPLEALRAQAIAARSYCLFIKHRFGSNRAWDVRATQANQVYRGISAERRRCWQAVETTVGRVLTSSESSHPDRIFPAYFSSVCGGHTENSRNVFGDSYAPLEGVECPGCRLTAPKKYLDWPGFAVSKKDAYEILKKRYPSLEKLGSLVRVEVIEKSSYPDFDRILRVRLLGENGTSDNLRGEDFRLSIDPTGMKLKSCGCRLIDQDSHIVIKGGTGFGHGIGLCQYGSLYLAQKGTPGEDILYHYYPGAEIVKLY